MNTDVIRRKLRDFRTRAATIAELSETGEAKIDEITPLLQDRHEGVRWSAIRILSEIADLRAVGPLLSLLEQEKNVSDVALALESITGQTFGDDLLAWKQWAMQTSDCPTESIPNLLSDAELIAAATEDLPVTVSGSGLEFSVSVKLDEGRSQQIWVDFSHQDSNGHALVKLSTPCGNADPSHYEAALKLNMSISFGAIAIAALDETLCFAVTNTHLRLTAHAEDIANSIMSLAQHGDSVEKMLSNEDTY